MSETPDFEIAWNGTIDRADIAAQQRQPEPPSTFPRRMDLSTQERIIRLLRADRRRLWEYLPLAKAVGASESATRGAVSRLVEDGLATVTHIPKASQAGSYARVQATKALTAEK